jgi:cytochrome c-type biogenesis protein CcmF
MIPELGHFALILALLLALTQAVLPLVGAQRGNLALMAVARPAAQGQFLSSSSPMPACLAFLTNDFSVINVARNSFSQLPEVYRFTATWGSHEGSLLFWVLILAFWTTAVSPSRATCLRTWWRACSASWA